MALCFEVTINDEPPILAGLPDLKVLSAILSFVSTRNELELDVGALVDSGDHVRWLQREMRRGDMVTIRITDSEKLTDPIARVRINP